MTFDLSDSKNFVKSKPKSTIFDVFKFFHDSKFMMVKNRSETVKKIKKIKTHLICRKKVRNIQRDLYKITKD